MLAKPVPLASVAAVDTPSLPALALANVPLVVFPNVKVSLFCKPDKAPVPLNASTVLPL